MKYPVRVRVNGRLYEEEVETRLLLVQFLRESLGLTSVHVGCVVGECGACSVLLDGRLAKSCLFLAAQADGAEVVTVEGLERDGALHPIQEAFIEEYALQCGYCTPGMILASHALLSRTPEPREEEIRRGLAGNLCMCTGYGQIVQAVAVAAKRLQAGGGDAHGDR